MKKLILIVSIFLSVQISNAAWLNFQEQHVTQPDGKKLDIFASGDEYYHWLHDQDGYTILQNDDGYYTYAIENNGNLEASKFLVGNISPQKLGLHPWLKISNTSYKAKKLSFDQPVREFRKDRLLFKSASDENVHTGALNNLTIFINFKDGDPYHYSLNHYNSILNTAPVSLYSYYKEVSYNKLFFTSHFYPLNEDSTSTKTYVDYNTRDYYRKYNKNTNTIGYQNDDERVNRLQGLLKNALEFIRDEVPGNLNIDKDGDGFIDNLTFVVQGDPDGWGDLIWPHMSRLYLHSVYINGSKAGLYTFQMESTSAKTFCHEMFHMLGAPDLYHYKDDYAELSPVGQWDLMESGFGHMGAWMKYRYAERRWISHIPEITESNRYTLKPLLNETGNAFLIRPRPKFETNEVFVLEYRKKEKGTYENNINGSGLLLYRIDSTLEGNADGPPDELYLYRPGGTTTVNGDIAKANMQDIQGYAVSDNQGMPAFLMDGTKSGLKIYDISVAGDSISFNVDLNRSSDADFLSFNALGQMGDAIIDSTSAEIFVQVERETELNKFRPTFKLSPFAESVPSSNDIVDISQPVKYRVEAEDGTIKEWTLYSEVLPNHRADIKSFKFLGLESRADINNFTKSVNVNVPYGTSITQLSPSAVISVGGYIYPDTLLPYDFTDPFTFTIVSEDQSKTSKWLVNVSVDQVWSSYNLEDLVDIKVEAGYIYIHSYQQDLNYGLYTLDGRTVVTGNINGNLEVKIPSNRSYYLLNVYNKLGKIDRMIRVNL